MARSIDPDDLVLVLVDVQSEFLDGMHGDSEPLLLRLERLAALAELSGLPVVVTLERPVERKGPLPERLATRLPPGSVTVEKATFAATGEAAFLAALDATGRSTVALAGSETDVCVLLTALGLLDRGFRVVLLEDCVCSSEPDPSAALARLRAAGAVPCTYKTLAYELTATVDRSAWPADWQERLAADPSLFPPPEDLPPREDPA